MAGYIGSKAVTLSTTAADVTGNATINGDLTVKGTTVTIDSAAAQEIRLGDNDKMTFGDATGGDLQIYHDGANSYVSELGTGDLRLGAANIRIGDNTSGASYIYATQNAEVTLYHNNSPKLATTSTGIDVTGSISADGLTVDGSSSIRHTDATTNISLTPTSTGGVVNVRDSSGNSQIVLDARTAQVGIGTSSPSQALHVVNPSTSYVLAETTGTGTSAGVRLKGDASADYTLFTTQGTNQFAIYDNAAAAERMRIDSSGNVGIGGAADTTQGYSKNLHIQAASTGSSLHLTDGTSGHTGTDGFELLSYNGTAYVIQRESNPLLFYTANTERMRISSNGSLIVGGTTDGAAGSIALQNDGNVIGVLASGAGGSSFISAISGVSNGYQIVVDASNNQTYRWHNAATQSMTLDSSGNLLVGTTGSLVAGAKVRASSIAATFEGEVTHAGGSGAVLWANRTSSDGWVAAWYRGGSSVGSISVTSSSTAYNTASDYRLKEDWQPMTGASDRVLALNPVNFAWKIDGSRVDGFLAHEAQAVVPEAVTGTKDAVDAEGNPEYQGIDQSKLVPLLTAALQEALTEIADLKARVTALETV